ncbi:hypothetical protein [Streptomyces sp. NPDC005262]|uniref:hypothetical protein n=1 Tax=Streptomyces sp. NPDC005262 TaxID=3364710 RepID=UPI0036B7AFB6
MSEQVVGKRQFGHKARLVLPTVLSFKIDEQAHAARAMWNLLHAWWLMMPGEKRTLANADAAIRQARKDMEFLAVRQLPLLVLMIAYTIGGLTLLLA